VPEWSVINSKIWEGFPQTSQSHITLVAIMDDRNSKQHLSKKRKSRNPNFENSALNIIEMKKIFLITAFIVSV